MPGFGPWYLVQSVGKSDFALIFWADNVVVVNVISKVGEAIYNLKLTKLNSENNFKYFNLLATDKPGYL